MKKRLVWLIALFLCLIVSGGLCACSEKPEISHTHSWSSKYTEDGDRHYQTCVDCNEKQYGTHSYNQYGYCICGKSNPAGETESPHMHKWSNTYIEFGDRHYQTCSGCEEKKYEDHSYNLSGSCVCGKQKPASHSHAYGAWTSDGASTHSRVCLCNDKETQAHNWNSGAITQTATCKDFGVKQYTCADCGETKTESVEKLTTHSWGYWMSTGSQNHSRVCSVCNKTETAEHNMVNDVCTICMHENETDFVFMSYRIGYAVTGYTGSAAKVAVPSKYKGKPVISIASEAFKFCTTITEIALPDTIQQIQSSAFAYCTKLKKATIPSCLSVGAYAFSNCASLTEIEFPAECLTYDSYLFSGCNSLQKITFNGGTIGLLTLGGCSSVKELVFGSDIISVSQSELKRCTALEYLTIPNLDCIDFTLNEYGREDVVITVNNGTYFPTKKHGISYGNVIAQIPTTDTTWRLNAATISVDNGRTAYNKGLDVEVLSWQTVSRYGYTWKEPVSSKVQCYYIDTTVKRVTITEQQLALNDERISKAPFEVIVLNRYPVNSLTVSGDNEAYTDEFNAATRNVTVTRSSGETETVKLDTLLSQADKQMLAQKGIHTVRLSYDGYSADWTITLKNHSFSGITFDSQSFYYDGTVKQLAVTGLPADTTVEYTNNSKTQIGTYAVTAKLIKQYYDEATFTATLTIKNNIIPLQYNTGRENVENPNPTWYDINSGLTLQTPACPMWEFMGWYKDANYSQQVESIAANSLDVSVLYAKWQSIFIVSNNTITGITDFGKTYSEIVIPSELNGEHIRGIGNEVFRNCSNLTSIEIPNNVTSIGDSAFYGCSRLTSIEIPNNVTSIENSVFAYCSGLMSIEIPNSVTDIRMAAFYGCSSLTSIEIPDSVTSIENSAFYNCSGLTSIEIPNSVTYIGESAFYGCSRLTSIGIPNNVTSIENSVFAYCSGLMSIEIPNSVTDITMAAFYDCSSLTSIEIPNSVTSIGYEAFCGCSSLTSIKIPDSVTYIGKSAFYNCSGLTSIEIPDSVTYIGKSAFYNCSGLTSIEIPNSVTYIWESAFYNCSGLTSIEIPNSVTYIGDSAFYKCSSLTRIEIPSSVTYIGDSAFYKCSSLMSITIPFVGATKAGNYNSLFGYIFGADSYDQQSRYVSSSLKTVIITGGSSIGINAFRDCSSLTSIEIPDSVTSIGKCAFYGCSGLTSIEIPNSVTSIESSVFCDCIRLTSVEMPNSVTSIGNYAFSYCSGLTSVTIGNSVTSIGDSAFYKCSSLTSIEIPNRESISDLHPTNSY